MDKQEVIKTIIERLAYYDIIYTEKDLIDWTIIGDETDEQIDEWVNDVRNDEHTERCIAKNAWRYEL